MKQMNYIVKRAQQDPSEGASKVSFVASTATPDRYGDIIDQKGWDLENYKKNPVVLLNHDSSQLPIGRGIVNVKEGQLVIDVEFDMDDPRAAEVARKANSGFMNAVSVGFQPTKSMLRSDLSKDSPYYGRKGQFFQSAELLEVSIVTIPANGEATMISQKDFDLFRSSILSEIRSLVRGELLSLPELRIKHILEVVEEEDRILISFAKVKEEPEEVEEVEEVEEEQLKAADPDEDDSTEDMPEEEQSYKDEEEEDDKKKFLSDLDKIAELFAQVI
mgnify:CR=1 FL=1|jgi:HK97 family phage prohead protease